MYSDHEPPFAAAMPPLARASGLLAPTGYHMIRRHTSTSLTEIKGAQKMEQKNASIKERQEYHSELQNPNPDPQSRQ